MLSPTVRNQAGRRGFSLVEILVSLTVLSIVGLIFTRILITQGRFTDQQNALRGARMVSRQAMNILESEIRMLQDSGFVDSAATNGKAIRVLVPYRFGLNCGVHTGRNHISMLPVDSLMTSQARYYGFAWRSNTGRYTKVLPAAPLGADAPVTSARPQQCTGSAAGEAQIRTLSVSGRAGEILAVSPAQASAPQGQPVFFFQRVTYTFKASTAFPTQNGLYRAVQGGTEEELMAPFDTSARFKYWKVGGSASVSAPPASLDSIRGFDIVFAARSSYTPMGKTAPSKSTVVASIFFKNAR